MYQQQQQQKEWCVWGVVLFFTETGFYCASIWNLFLNPKESKNIMGGELKCWELFKVLLTLWTNVLHADSTLETTWHCVKFGHAHCGSLNVRKVKEIYICYKLNEEERVHDGVQSLLFVWKDQQSNTTGCNKNIYALMLKNYSWHWKVGGNAWMQFRCCHCCSYWCIRGQLPRINCQPFFWLCLPPPPPTVVTVMKIVFVF